MAEKTDLVTLGVIGGSGVYHMTGVKIAGELAVKTPFGEPSSPIVQANIQGKTVYFLARHGKGHRYLPSEVNYRANIFALKSLGVSHVMSVSAVGIMKEKIKPGDMVVPDQIYDRTKGVRPATFFGDGIVGHVGFADPYCGELRQIVVKAAKSCGAKVHTGGTYVCMEGPQFSTRAESNYYRKAVNATVIGMTALPEAKLAREAAMCYATLALATDYDCWHESEDDVTVEAVVAVIQKNAVLANAIIQKTAEILPALSQCPCRGAAQYAIMTDRSVIPEETKKKLSVLFGRYF